MHFRIVLLIFLTTLLKVHGQDRGKLFPIGAKIVDESTEQALAYVHIYNESRRYGVISDTNGVFKMRVHVGDTLAFIALGYLGYVYYVQPADSTTEVIIALTPMTYNIEAVDVFVPRNMEQLKEAVFKTNPDDSKLDFGFGHYNPYRTPLLLDTNILDNTFFKIMHPVSGLYYKYSKKEKSKRKVWYLQNQELRQPEVDARYNKTLVTKLTGFEGDDLLNFMGYCDFDFDYLYNASDMEIIEAIEEKYTKYLACCYEPSEKNTPAE